MKYIITFALLFTTGCSTLDETAYETGKVVGKVTSLPEKVTRGMADSQIEEKDKDKHDPFGRDDD